MRVVLDIFANTTLMGFLSLQIRFFQRNRLFNLSDSRKQSQTMQHPSKLIFENKGGHHGGPSRGKRYGMIRHILERENRKWMEKNGVIA